MLFKKLFLCCAVALCFTAVCHAKKPAVTAKESVEGIFALADIQVNGSRPWDIQVHNDEFYARVLASGSLGLGESYMDGWWDCPNLDQFIYRVQRSKLSKRVKPSWDLAWEYVKATIFNLQDKVGAKKVIDVHYQLGNDLYKAMLDPLMVYSCGYWKNAKNLDEAEIAKFDIICRKLGFKPGMKVLDIGCGWGGFEKYAAENYGVNMIGITLSENQAERAREVCKGLPVEIRVQDYRDVKDQFDRVVEIGMFEHVGPKNYREFMEICHRNLKPGGQLMLHTIGRDTSSVLTDPWINKYIFPNGVLPSIAQIAKSSEGLFIMEDWHNFGADYDKTLMAWFQNFNANWDKLQPTYSDRFYRMWKYYLLSCAGSFRARHIQLWQVVFSKDGIEGGHESVR